MILNVVSLLVPSAIRTSGLAGRYIHIRQHHRWDHQTRRRRRRSALAARSILYWAKLLRVAVDAPVVFVSVGEIGFEDRDVDLAFGVRSAADLPLTVGQQTEFDQHTPAFFILQMQETLLRGSVAVLTELGALGWLAPFRSEPVSPATVEVPSAP